MTFKTLCSALAAWLLLVGPAAANSLSDEEQRMADWIDAHAEDAIALLEETVNISSGTMNPEGVREVGKVMRRELDALGLDTRIEPDLTEVGFGDWEGKTRQQLIVQDRQAFERFYRDPVRYPPAGAEPVDRLRQRVGAVFDRLTSEHAAHMMAMDNATKACNDMIENLTLAYNKARQAAITADLMDIVGGAEALKG